MERNTTNGDTKMELYHGTHNNLMGTGAAHEGMCFTESEESAQQYAGSNGTVYTIDIAGLNVVECEGYDRDENYAPADSDSFRAAHAANGADILRYSDEDENGREHECFRLVSEKAVAAVMEQI
jgi:hypothetical protein